MNPAPFACIITYDTQPWHKHYLTVRALRGILPDTHIVLQSKPAADVAPHLAQALLSTKDSLCLSRSEGTSWQRNLKGLHKIAQDLQSKRWLDADMATAASAAGLTKALLGALSTSLRHHQSCEGKLCCMSLSESSSQPSSQC